MREAPGPRRSGAWKFKAMFKITSFPAAATLLATGLALTACGGSVGIPASEKKGKAPAIEAAFIRFPDMPLPVGVDFDMDRTLVFGADDSWFGRLVINSSHSANEMFDFYKQKLPEFGWQEITSIRAAISVLTFSRQDRVTTIQVQSGTLLGSEVFITVSPLGNRRMPGAAMPGAPAQ